MKPPTNPPRRRHSRRLALPAMAAIVACALLPASAYTKQKPAKPLYWGAVIGKQLTGEAPPSDFNAVAAFEQIAGKGISLLSFSQPFADCSTICRPFPFPKIPMETLREHGTIPFLSWASQSVPSSLNQPAYKLSAVINGAHDPYIREFAEVAKEWGYPFFLRFDAEMNGFWFPWSEGVNGNKPGEFVAAWRHVRDIFTQVGTTNATWVWCPNVDFTKNLTPLEKLYPGDAYVDWTCIDGFNWGKTRNSVGWQSFDQVFSSTYKRIAKIAPRKPMVIGETASEERGGSKANWIKETFKVIPQKYRKVRAVIWFDEKDQGMHWPIESSKSAANAFAKSIARPIFRPNEFVNMTPGSRVYPPPGG
ncbi:MAG TPA: glycosyl hydrolase [Solirubrobacterales bacterium]|nr:glycosyl hydrolase [Solirubrobacterales bacterium]